MLTRSETETELLPAALEYAVLTPAGVDEHDDLPLVLLLHGGNGSREFLAQMQPLIEEAWNEERLPPAVVVTPSCGRSFYMNYRDGSQRWEDAVLGPLLSVIQREHGASAAREATVVAGISMGGMGALRMAFRHPERFRAVAAMEPGIEPALSFADIELQDRFWRDDDLFEQIFGSPVDDVYWAANNPATIAADDPERLRAADLSILLECGDQDSFGLHRGTEFLHRVLFDHEISHDYHLIQGADHLGRTIPERFSRVLDHLAVALEPPPPDDTLGDLHGLIDALRRRAGLDVGRDPEADQ